MLTVEALETAYGDSQILFGIDLAVASGEVLALLGRNGMGKTTTVRSLLGLTRARGGSVRFQGERIEALAPDRIARMGLAVVPEGRQIFPNLSVSENLRAFGANRNASREPWTLERVYALFPRLAERSRNMGNQFSGGEQQMLAIGRALMSRPSLLMLDEAYGEFAPPGTLPPLDVSNPNVLRFRTFSKAYGMAGMRLGYAVGHADLITAFDKIRNHFGVTRIGQAAGLAALADQQHLRDVIAKVADARDGISAIARAPADTVRRPGASLCRAVEDAENHYAQVRQRFNLY